MKLSTILDQIDIGAMALPEFQRGYVWNREQVRSLMHSLYRRHPVGGLLVWVTKTEQADAHARGDGTLAPGSVKLLLDGQQRITSLYGIIRGTPPKFFEGNQQSFTGLHFNLEEENFEFYAPLKMRDNPVWVDVTELMQKGVGPYITRLFRDPAFEATADTFAARLNALHGIKEIDFHIEEVTGDDKTVDVVVDIFNRVNSGGTKLSKGDLALAKVCAAWPDARDEMKKRLDRWRKAGFHFRLEWLLRCINAILTGEALFSALKDVDTATFQKGLVLAEKHIDTLLNMIAARLGLDHDDVLGSRYSFPLLARYLHQRGGQLSGHQEQGKLLFWYIHTFLWGRYAGSTETVLNQDLHAIEMNEGALDRLIAQLRQNRGDLRLHSRDFEGWSRGARFYPLLYMLTRVWHARDWGSGVELRNHLLGQMSSLELHHIFPKALLYKHGYERADVNALANFAFLTKETNLRVSDRDPADYLEEFVRKHPGAVESHWIPMDRELWKAQNYAQFLAARRELLAKAGNDFLDSLLHGVVPQEQVEVPIVERKEPVVLGAVGTEDEERLLLETNLWVMDQGLPEGELMYELIEPNTREVVALLDLAWPRGLQEGLSSPVALLLDESSEIEEIVNKAGYLFFTNVDDFHRYVKQEILAVPELAA